LSKVKVDFYFIAVGVFGFICILENKNTIMIHSSKFLVLRELELFRSLNDQQLEQIANQASFVKYDKGDYVYKNDEEITDIYILHKGSVKCGRQTVGDKVLLKEIVYKRELLGENVLSNSKVRSEFAQTLSEVELFKLPVKFFRDMLEKNPQLCQELTMILINKMANLEKRLSNFVFKKAQSRIVEFLKELASAKGIKIGLEEILINHGLSHKEIANITDTSRQTVARVLGDLKRQNIIHFSPRKPHKILIRNVMNLS